MKQTKLLSFLIALLIVCACKNDSKLQEKEDKKAEKKEEYQKIKDPNCIAPADWFTIVDGTRKTPAPDEGPTSVFANNETVTNCDFHQWSWQKFLWLTNETKGQPMFLNDLKQVTSHGQKLERKNGIVLTDTAQASGASDILKTPKFASGTPPSTTVYYAIFMNDLLYDAMIKYAPIAKENPDAVKDITYPIGALELKTSWIDVKALPDASSYFVTDGEINGVKTKVALLGIHVVGVVENHPEFIWATFEHESLAPDYDWSKATPTSDAPITSTTNYPFFNKEDTATVKNITSGNGIYTNIFSVYKYGTPVEIKSIDNKNVQVFMKSSQNGSQNFNNIRIINKSVKEQLSGIWNNYFYNGSIWIDTAGYVGTKAQAALLDSLSVSSGGLHNADTTALARGSVAAYNITMETYVQVGFHSDGIYTTKVGDLVNCFLCHSTSHGKQNSPLNLSHVYNGYLDSLNGLSKTETKLKHIQLVRERSQQNKQQSK
ncbi:hypothetical protein ABW636_11590 [Aquimarina sp. 2201CG1-2-11]|uniref:hypothetical protein n=1 Tax=Aquimarina discodermiae TaxID=3231043 RepID=UPI0034635A8A